MQKKANTGVWWYIIGDYLAAFSAWFFFFIYRKTEIEKATLNIQKLISDKNFILGMFFIPLCWLCYYYLYNTYNSLIKKSRLLELYKTLLQTIIGSIILFFGLMLDDIIKGYKDYYFLFVGFIFIHFTFTIFFRLIVLTYIKNKINNGKIFLSTLYIGNDEKLKEIEDEIAHSKIKLPYRITQKLILNNRIETVQFPITDVEEIIIATGGIDLQTTERYIIHFLNQGKTVQILQDELDIVYDKFKTQNVFGSPLIEISAELMQPWQILSKRLVDIMVSALGLVFLSPVFILIILKIKTSSKGSIFFKQERIGLNGKPFLIIKFRSMIEGAEQDIPQLTSENDHRITPFGKTMRKYRIDELPQLWNVLKNDMSLVGPRPERKYFINQIIQTAPQYLFLQRLKPGITSLGMVKYGYASSLDEMHQRMRYDLLYLKHISILLDIKILIYTIIILWKGKGK